MAEAQASKTMHILRESPASLQDHPRFDEKEQCSIQLVGQAGSLARKER